MKQYEIKNTSLSDPLDVDLSAGIVKVVWSTMEMEDSDRDIIDAGAYTKTIMERGPKGSNLIAALVDHSPSVMKMYGKPSELYMENNQLIAVIPVVKTELGKDLMVQYASGLINQQSVGFQTMRDEEDRTTGVRRIKELKLYEGSAVVWGANWMTPTLDMVRVQGKDAAIEYMVKREQIMTKTMRNCDFTDDTHILLEIQLKQLQSALGSLKAEITKEENNEEFAQKLQKLISLAKG